MSHGATRGRFHVETHQMYSVKITSFLKLNKRKIYEKITWYFSFSFFCNLCSAEIEYDVEMAINSKSNSAQVIQE